MRTYRVGERVVYRKQKASSHPTQRARELHPSAQGETYSYLVDKYWRVTRLLDDARLEVKTPTGKLHTLQVTDPRLRPATCLERILKRNRFPA